MNKDDISTLAMMIANTIKEKGLDGLPKSYKFNTNFDEDSVVVEFKNYANVSRSFKIKVEAI